MKFKLLYAIFIIAILLYGSFRIADTSLTLRNLFALIMGFACWMKTKKLYMDKYLLLYFIFVFFFGISSIATGYVIDFLHELIGFVFVAYIAYWATIIIIRKYNSLSILVYVIIGIGVFDSLVTVSQVFYIPFFDSLLKSLYLGVSNDVFIEKQLIERDLMGISIPGIFDTAVRNGHFLILSTLLSLYVQKNGFKLLGYLITVVMLVGLFFCQQRAPFFISGVLLIYVFYKLYGSGKSGVKKIILTGIIVTVLWGGVTTFMPMLLSGDFRFSEGLESSERRDIYTNTINWILEHPLGGIFDVRKIVSPHNFFLNAFVYAGWLGGWFMVIDLFLQMLLLFKNLRVSDNNLKFSTVVLISAYLGLTINSMVHNVSIVTGDALTWISWAAFYANSSRWKTIPNRFVNLIRRPILNAR